MKSQNSIKRISMASLLVVALTIGAGGSASAHVTVKPAEVVTAGYQTFTVGVPNEKDTPTVSVRLVIPEAIASVTPTQKAGWTITQSEESGVKSVTWTGGEIGVGLRDEFTFSTKAPEETIELQWKAYQSYADGTTVSWDQAGEGGHGEGGDTSGPFSVTKVVSETAGDAMLKKADQAAADAQMASSRAILLSAAALATSLVGIFLATRKK